MIARMRASFASARALRRQRAPTSLTSIDMSVSKMIGVRAGGGGCGAGDRISGVGDGGAGGGLGGRGRVLTVGE